MRYVPIACIGAADHGGATTGGKQWMLAALLTVMLPATSAFGASETRVDIGPCLDLEDRLERFDCYEGLAEQARQRKAQGTNQNAERASRESAAPADNAAAEDDTPSDQQAERRPAGSGVREDFGLPTRPEPASERETAEVLHASIAELEEYKPNQWRITLDNGQVWLQVVGKRFRLREGHNVSIRETGWGKNYRLSAEEIKGQIQVRRLQ